MTDNKLVINKSVNGLDDHRERFILDGFNYLKASDQEIWWDTFSIDDSLCVIQNFEETVVSRVSSNPDPPTMTLV